MYIISKLQYIIMSDNFMKRILSRIYRGARINKKKKKGLLSLTSSKTFYLTFFVSLLAHASLIYTIPEVKLFSEGAANESPEAIVVDFFQDADSEGFVEILQPDDNQFQADNPPVEPEPEMDSTEEEIDPVESDELPPVEHVARFDEDYTLLSQPDLQEPQLVLREKQAPQQVSLHPRQTLTKRSQPPKLSVRPTRKSPALLQTRVQEHKPVSINPLQAKRSPEQERSASQLQFPVQAHNIDNRQQDDEQALPEQRFTFGKKQTSPQATQEMPALLQTSGSGSSRLQKRHVGMEKEKETDRNRFGIFAGKKYEEPLVKETVQQAALSEETKETANSEEAEQARQLETESQIEGPVKGRALVRRPQPPKVDLASATDLIFKFWVLPDGTIGEVIPIKRGDARLEQIAISYLKQWHFEPLASNVPQQKIWGTIPIRFTVK